ncbi:MAG: thioredoxin family protein [Bacteroidota bacterium]|nr:thioredoxin family protein [Bacteroidota bacterium]
MKKTLLTLISFAFILVSFKSAKEGVNFQSGNWSEVTKEAKEEGKPIFALVCTSSCSRCAKMKEDIFSDPEVARYFNENFVSIIVNPDEDPMSNMRVTNWGVTTTPSYVFLDSKKKVQHIGKGLMTKEEILEEAESALGDM